MSRACTEPRSLLLLTQPMSEGPGDAQEFGKGHSQVSWLQLTKGTFHTIGHCGQHAKLVEDGVKGHVWSDVICLSKSLFHVWWSSAVPAMVEHPPGPWQVLHAWILLYLLNSFYLQPQVFPVLPFQISSTSHHTNYWVVVWGRFTDWD